MSDPHPEPGPLELSLWARSDVGRVRSENQDAFLVTGAVTEEGRRVHLTRESRELRADGRRSEGEGADTSQAEGAATLEAQGARGIRCRTEPGGTLLLVADGMGGVAGGAEAARIAVETVAEAFKRPASGEQPDAGLSAERSIRQPGSPRDSASAEGAFPRRLEASVREANRRIRAVAAERPALRGMGTTATLAGIRGGTVHVAQVGDSRAYLVRDGVAERLTRDQSLVQELVDRGEMTPEEAERSPRRHVLLQALGTEFSADVALTRHPLRAGDHLLLCSDGLTGVVGDAEIASVVSQAAGPRAACDELAALADDRGGPDNITVVVARIEAAE